MKKYILSIVLLSSILLTGCDDFLKEESENKFTMATLFETPEGLEKMVLAFYPFERSFATSGSQNGYLAAHMWSERTTDCIAFTTGEDAGLSRYNDPGPAANNLNTLIYNTFWSRRYQLIGRASEVIYYGERMGDAAKYSVAEASFWRAYCYYGLYSRYSRLVLITEPSTKENLTVLSYKPAETEEIFNLMYADLIKAIDGLPLVTTAENKGRVTRASARHLKALVAAWDKNWQVVANQADSLEIEGTHKLEASTSTIFAKSNLCDSPEALFALNFEKERGGGSGHRIGTQSIAVAAEVSYTWLYDESTKTETQYHEGNLGASWGLAFPNRYLISLHPKGDKRLKDYIKTHYTYGGSKYLKIINSIASKGIPPRQKLTDTNTGLEYYTTTNTGSTLRIVQIGDTIWGRDIWEATKNNKTYATKYERRQLMPSSLKYCDLWSKPIDIDHGSASFKDVMIYRLSETMLLGAEAYMHLGNQPKARYYYNKTWTRAGNQAITNNITFEMIRDEQARELSFEGRRWDFLKRNGIWFEQVRQYMGDFTVYPGDVAKGAGFDASTYGISDGRDPKFGPDPNYYVDFNGDDRDAMCRFNVKSIHVNWPIPQSQIEAMGPSFPQTDGYK